MISDTNNTSFKKAIFITGATGLLGSYLLKELVHQNKKIKALYRSEIPKGFDSVDWIKGDIFDVSLLDVEKCAAGLSLRRQCFL